jgi:hypothetical protein
MRKIYQNVSHLDTLNYQHFFFHNKHLNIFLLKIKIDYPQIMLIFN